MVFGKAGRTRTTNLDVLSLFTNLAKKEAMRSLALIGNGVAQVEEHREQDHFFRIVLSLEADHKSARAGGQIDGPCKQ